MHPGQGPGLSLHDLGETGGSDSVTLLQSEIPTHTHTLSRQHERGGPAACPAATWRRGRVRRRSTRARPTQNLVAMAPEALTPAGGDQPHNNLQPYLTLYFNIALQGVFPPRT